MKYVIAIFLSLLLTSDSKSQTTSYPFYQLYQLDSIGKCSSITRHFGELYFQFLQRVEEQLDNADTTTKRLVRNFEAVFAQFYIDACIAYENHSQVPLPAWRGYFTNASLKPDQYKLLGTNAHLNGGLAEAIAHSYTPEEWKSLKKKYVLFNICLNTTYHQLRKETIRSNKKARTISVLTLGLDKMIGQYYLYKWRKRQMRLTEYYFAGSPKYNKLLNKVNRKKERIDKMVCNQL
ncbi:MAG: DUF5995 family protein [Chitinophagaceae bacterium]